MLQRAAISVLPLLASCVTALAIIASQHERPLNESPTMPLVLWHGLGDSFDSDGIKSVLELYQQTYPGAYAIAISQGGKDGGADRKASFLGNLTTQLAETCETLLNDEQLDAKHAPLGINALGFSQGGQFVRGLVQQCGGLNFKNLVTFGSQHLGIDEFAECQPGDWWCRAWSGTLRSNTWSDLVQRNVVPAQYFRDPADLENYLEHSNYLADINNERALKNVEYPKRLSRLEKFVMLVFDDDEVVKPKESGWFAEVNRTSGIVSQLEDLQLYKEDWIGLKKLKEKGALTRATVPGGHMQLDDNTLSFVFETYFSPKSTVVTTLEEDVDDL